MGKPLAPLLNPSPITLVRLCTSTLFITPETTQLPSALFLEVSAAIPSAKELSKLHHDEECCASCSSRTAIRAAREGDLDLMRAVLTDRDHVADPMGLLSVDRIRGCLDIAIQRNDIKMVILLLEYQSDPKKFIGEGSRVSVPSHSLLAEANTGNHSRYTYTHRVRKVTIGRGGKEGNAALCRTDRDVRFETLESYWSANGSNWPLNAVRRPDLDMQLLEFLMLSPLASTFDDWIERNNLVYHACEAGNYRVAGHMVEHLGKLATSANSYGNRGFNALHVQALKTRAGEELPAYRKQSVLKKSGLNLTPLHMAAINPNTEVLKQLLASLDYETNHADMNGRLPIHFAAASESPENLKLLIKHGSNPKAADKHGIIPLHLAAKYGRAENIKWLLYHSTSEEEKFDGKYHDRKGKTALSIAGTYREGRTSGLAPLLT